MVNTKWAPYVQEFLLHSNALAIGILHTEGHFNFRNEAMNYLLDPNMEASDQLINPSFEDLKAADKSKSCIFNAYITIGNYLDKSYSMPAKIYFNEDEFLILAHLNIAEILEDNKIMSKLNQQVNNLQRELIKEKQTLQQTYEELKNTQSQLIQSEKMNAMGQLVAGIAHEINNPLAFSLNNIYQLQENFTLYNSALKETEKLLKKQDLELQKDYIKIIEENDLEFINKDNPELLEETKSGLNRVKEIILDLRKFSRLDESDVKRVDLVSNLNSVFSILKSEIKSKNIQLHINTPQSIEIDCYPGQLNQAILNILLNAIQAVKNGGSIHFSIELIQQNIEITISDNGPGIDSKIIDQIFNPFFTTKDIGSGTGLGLSISYKIIKEIHKGEIIVGNKAPNGAEFIILVPTVIK